MKYWKTIEEINPCFGPPSQEWANKYCEWIVKRFFADYPETLNKSVEVIRKHVEKSGLKVLDVGCGNGIFMKAFESLGLQANGIDFEPQVGKAKKANLEKDRFPFADESFDFILLRHTIEHISNTDHLLSECHRVLKKGGKIFIETPDFPSSVKFFYDDPTHKKPFTIKSLLYALQMNRFDAKTKYFRNIPFLWKYTLKAFDYKFSSFFPTYKKIIAIGIKK